MALHKLCSILTWYLIIWPAPAQLLSFLTLNPSSFILWECWALCSSSSTPWSHFFALLCFYYLFWITFTSLIHLGKNLYSFSISLCEYYLFAEALVFFFFRFVLFFTSRKSSYLKMEYIVPSMHVKNSLRGSSEMDFCNFSIRTDVLSCDSAWWN